MIDVGDFLYRAGRYFSDASHLDDLDFQIVEGGSRRCRWNVGQLADDQRNAAYTGTSMRSDT